MKILSQFESELAVDLIREIAGPYYRVYSEKRKGYRRIKFFGARRNAKDLKEFGVEAHKGPFGMPSFVVRTPLSFTVTGFKEKFKR